MADEIEKTSGRTIQFVNFRLGDEEFGADTSSVREITRVADISHIPEAPSFIKGVINLRGQIIAVIDLCRQFGLAQPEQLPESARIVVTEVKGQTVGMLVDAVPEVLNIPEENIEATPELIRTKLEKGYIHGVARMEDRLIILLDLEKVIAGKEVEEAVRAGAGQA